MSVEQIANKLRGVVLCFLSFCLITGCMSTGNKMTGSPLNAKEKTRDPGEKTGETSRSQQDFPRIPDHSHSLTINPHSDKLVIYCAANRY